MSAAHTPGPWEVSTGCDQYVASGGKWIASTMGIRGDEGAANARLIAAAPELLEALESVKWRSADRDNMEFAATITFTQMDAILAAIAKARGAA